MPDRARTICLNCTQLATPGSKHCETHALTNRAALASRERNAERRASGLKRLYDRKAWRQQTVPVILARDPLCRLGVLCGGRAVSTDVDHIVRAEVYVAMNHGDPLSFFDMGNLQGICHADHSRKTAMENAGVWKEPVGQPATGGGSNV